MNKKIKSTAQEFVESLTQNERKQFDKEYRDLLFSEILISAREKDEISIKKLVKLF